MVSWCTIGFGQQYNSPSFRGGKTIYGCRRGRCIREKNMSKAFDAAAQQRLLESRATLARELARQQGADACEGGASVDEGIGVGVREGAGGSSGTSGDQGRRG